MTPGPHVFDRHMNPAALEAQKAAGNLSKKNRNIKATIFALNCFKGGHI